MLEWMEASDPVEPRRKVEGQERETWEEREGERERRNDGTCSFIRSFTPVATATCLEGTGERRHRWQKQERSRDVVRGNDSKSRHKVRVNEGRKAVVSTPRSVNLTFRDAAKTCNEHPFISGGHPINVGIALL